MEKKLLIYLLSTANPHTSNPQLAASVRHRKSIRNSVSVSIISPTNIARCAKSVTSASKK